MSRAVDWLLIGRYALLISLTALIPVPFLDRWVENYLRRRLVSVIAGRQGVALSREDAKTLGHAPSGGCMGCLWAVIMWPIRKVLRTILVFWQAKVMADTASEILHRSLMLEEALEVGWIPGDALKVRQAMDRTLSSIDTRVFERQLAGVFMDHTNDWNRWVHRRTGSARRRVKERAEALADAAEQEGLSAEADAMSQAMASALRATGAVPEALQWFRAEMGADLQEEPALTGVLQPTVLPPDGEAPRAKPLAAEVAEAEELPPVQASPPEAPAEEPEEPVEEPAPAEPEEPAPAEPEAEGEG